MPKIPNVLIALFIFVAVTALFPAEALAGELVLSGSPVKRVNSDPTLSKETVLTDQQAAEFQTVIIKDGGRYFWATRENRELFYTSSGVYDMFIDPRGGGFVKVLRGDNPLEESGINFMEVVTLGFQAILYWGHSEIYEP